MKHTQKIKNELDNFFLNLKAEVILAEHIENSKLTIEDITVRNQSSFSRGYRRDIIDTKINPQDKLQINLSRNGIYDALPQGIFHSSVALNSDDTYSKLRQKSKKEESDARMLFAPLENEFFLHKILVEQQERKLALEFNNLNNSYLLDFWELKDKVANEYVFLLAKALPMAYKISKNEKLIGQCLSEILKEKIIIEKKFINLQNTNDNRTKDYVLGVDTVLELKKTRVLQPYYYINIELSSLKNKNKYNEYGIATRLISVFCDYFVPLEIDWEVVITHNYTYSNFELDKESAFLGLSTTI